LGLVTIQQEVQKYSAVSAAGAGASNSRKWDSFGVQQLRSSLHQLMRPGAAPEGLSVVQFSGREAGWLPEAVRVCTKQQV
jgi:hypothetical protein